MDVDLPGSLKRSSSAPMINELTTTMTTASTTTSARDALPYNIFASEPRTRRFSASFSPVSSPSLSPLPPRFTPRVSQLRLEECVDVAGREAAHERDTVFTMQMSQSWEDLTLVPGNGKSEHGADTNRSDSRRMVQRVLDPLHVTLPLSPPVCSSPSPTRPGLGRQCFSPGLHMHCKTSPSPSPTRKAFATSYRRSLSPTITMRPSSLSQVKRKFELDEEKGDHYLTPPAKRASYGGLLIAHSGRLDTTSSPLPGSLSSVGTPESVSSADSPGFTFRPVDSPSPGRPLMTIVDEPMQEERTPESKQDQVMATVDQEAS